MDKNYITKKSYDNISDKYSKLHFGPSNMLLSFFHGLMEIKNKSTILDIGAGTGRDAVELSKYFNNVICLDYSKYMLDTINVKNNMTFVVSDILDDKLTFNKLSSIWMNGVIHHIDPKQHEILFKRLYEWLDDTAPLFISYRHDLSNSFDNEFSENPRYYYKMNYKDIIRNLEKIGFSLVRHFEVKKKPTDTKSWIYIKALKNTVGNTLYK